MAAEPQNAEEVNPALVTALCTSGLHTRCPGWVVTFPTSGPRRLARTHCQCPTPNCGHGPRPRKRK